MFHNEKYILYHMIAILGFFRYCKVFSIEVYEMFAKLYQFIPW